jgi:hypothetical protein
LARSGQVFDIRQMAKATGLEFGLGAIVELVIEIPEVGSPDFGKFVGRGIQGLRIFSDPAGSALRREESPTDFRTGEHED